MIWNLNPLSFKDFGAVTPERTAQDTVLAKLPKAQELTVKHNEEHLKYHVKSTNKML